MKDGEVFNPNEAIVYIMYLDANNIYGWVMSKPLPVGNFKWMTRGELGLPAEEMPPCFIKVDLEYPENLHGKFSELVPAPDKIVPEETAPNLLPKKGYTWHIENLRQYVGLGVRLVKVRSGIKFDQKDCRGPTST